MCVCMYPPTVIYISDHVKNAATIILLCDIEDVTYSLILPYYIIKKCLFEKVLFMLSAINIKMHLMLFIKILLELHIIFAILFVHVTRIVPSKRIMFHSLHKQIAQY